MERKRDRKYLPCIPRYKRAHQETDVKVEIPAKADNYFDSVKEPEDVKKAWIDTLSDLNVCSQKGLVEMFDSSIGAGTVTMPYGGKYQLTPTQTMIAKLPVMKGKTIRSQ